VLVLQMVSLLALPQTPLTCQSQSVSQAALPRAQGGASMPQPCPLSFWFPPSGTRLPYSPSRETWCFHSHPGRFSSIEVSNVATSIWGLCAAYKLLNRRQGPLFGSVYENNTAVALLYIDIAFFLRF
jgi:hypothetical protein